MQEICKTEMLTEQIEICTIEILNFIKHIFREFPDRDYRFERNIVVTNEILSTDFFSETELEKINSFKTLKKQVEWMCGRYAVKYLTLLKREDLIAKDIVLDYQEFGAPYIKSLPDYQISISHSNKYAIAGLSTNKNICFGIDLEKFEKSNFEKSMLVAFSDREISYLENQPYSKRYHIWTAKEAYLKYIKKGFHENLKSIEIIDNIIYFNNEKIELNLLSKSIDEDYSLSIVYND